MPIAVGFGVKDAAYRPRGGPSDADGVVVGSAFINVVASGGDVEALAREIVAGCQKK